PHPEIYLTVAEAIGVKPKHCLVFEDTPAGAESAHRAGCKVIVVTTTHSEDEFTNNPSIVKFIPDFTAINLDELMNL
ncbi:MAG: HAD family hydrolase, partial [Balneolaceae bacterium]